MRHVAQWFGLPAWWALRAVHPIDPVTKPNVALDEGVVLLRHACHQTAPVGSSKSEGGSATARVIPNVGRLPKRERQSVPQYVVATRPEELLVGRQDDQFVIVG